MVAKLTVYFSEAKDQESLAEMWRGYFAEVPHCSQPGCNNVASEVDDYFPYLDDLNRCDEHLNYREPPQREQKQGCGAKTRTSARGQVRQPSHWRSPANT